jgi:hypothetical protein
MGLNAGKSIKSIMFLVVGNENVPQNGAVLGGEAGGVGGAARGGRERALMNEYWAGSGRGQPADAGVA